MKVLIVKKKDSCWPFVEEQVAAIRKLNELPIGDCRLENDESPVEVEWHLKEGRGMKAYVWDVWRLMRDIRRVKPDVIHAHYGISGYYVCLVTRMIFWKKRVPVVVTYHGSDINRPKVQKISQRAIRMADYNIFVSPKLKDQVQCGENSEVIPCGLNMEDWPEMSKEVARKKMGLSMEKRYVLFSSDFQTAVKNPELAKAAIEDVRLKIEDLELIELTGYTREQVNALMHGVDVCLMTSFTEGSPQFIKEAMVCGCPIVTTRVGDVEYVIGETDGCYFTDSVVKDCAKQLEKAMDFSAKHDRTKGRERIVELGYDNIVIANIIRGIYSQIVYGV